MLKIGITGLGFMGMIHYLAYQQLHDVQVTAICETIPERRNGDWTSIKGNFGPQGTKMDLTGIATYANLNELLADPNVDLLDICLPPNAHATTAIAALNAGKHVLSEKPIALKLEDADNMVAAAKTNNKLFMVAHVLPFFTAYRFVYEAVQSGCYGKLLGGHFNRVISDPTWLKNFYDMNTIGGPLLDLHIHDAHFIRLLFGLPKTVQSSGRLRAGTPEYFSTQFLYDDPNILVTSNSGCIFQQGRPFMANFEVHFEKATLVLDGQTPTILTEDGKSEKATLPNLDEIAVFANELSEVANSAQKNTVSPILGGQLARDALYLALKEMESIHSRKPVNL
ncbi:MAG: Gfo/Idh/MocA family oxidoreductase [Planctomycetaceae bacterium]|jgi:predicted dehydrogenase|nr:Gfo/Idh/MocA family oxidoreductase [Planctomycetaceae bacterium]